MLEAKTSLRIGLLCLVSALACSEPEAGGQSGAEGHTNRPPIGPGGSCVPPINARDFDPKDSLKLATGRHELTLAWQALDPFSSPKGRSMRVVVDVEPHGDIYSNLECQIAQIDATATLEFPELSETIVIEGIVMMHDGDALLWVETTRPLGRSLSVPGAALSRDTNGHHRLMISFKVDGAPSGFIDSWTDHGEGNCMRATLPADGRACPWAAREVGWDTRIGDFALDDALAMLERIGPQQLTAAAGAETSLELTFMKADAPVCADIGWYAVATAPLPSSGAFGALSAATQLTAPVMAHARTADGSFDVTFPLTLRAVASEESGLELIPGSRATTSVDSQIDLGGTALALTKWLGSSDAEAASDPMLLKFEMSINADQVQGRLVASELKRKNGWPALKPPREPDLQPLTEVECVGLQEGAVVRGGYFGPAD